MKAAVERSLLESVAVYWMMRKSFQDQNYKAALRYADILMRTRPQALGHIMPIMGKMAELPRGVCRFKVASRHKPAVASTILRSLPERHFRCPHAARYSSERQGYREPAVGEGASTLSRFSHPARLLTILPTTPGCNSCRLSSSRKRDTSITGASMRLPPERRLIGC